MNVEEYDAPEEIKRIYESPDMWVGNDERVEKSFLVLKDNKIESSIFDFPDACQQIFYEGISNSSDAINRSRRKGYRFEKGAVLISVTMNNKTVSIKNLGISIPIDKHPKFDCYVPELIFGRIGGTSNFKVKERHEAGRNGLGAKTLNIFSKKFTVIVCDSEAKLRYEQTWAMNMDPEHKGEPRVTPYSSGPSSVEIIYVMDFERFKYPSPKGSEGGYPLEVQELFARICADTSFVSKCKVSFNDKVFDYSYIRDYGALYFGQKAMENSICHYQLKDGTRLKKVDDKQLVVTSDAKNEQVTVPELELLLIDPALLDPERKDNYSGSIFAFVNCLLTTDGGIHIETLIDELSPQITKQINGNSTGKNLITKRQVRPLLTGILSVRLVNPKFTSQAKTKLASPKPVIDVPAKTLKPIFSWGMMDRLRDDLKLMQMSALIKTDGKKSRFVDISKAKEANNAGKKGSEDCRLILIEGDSAMGYALYLVSVIENGSDIYGIYPLKGKIQNVSKADPLKMAANKEICDIKQILGLKENTDYTSEENFSQLRYGGVLVMTDADSDGSHIKGLIFNLFFQQYPSLLARGYVEDYRTKYLRASKGKKKQNFYTPYEFDTWKKANEDYSSWNYKYYKGLATSEDADIVEDSKKMKIISLEIDDHSKDLFKLVFGKDDANFRKKWIRSWSKSLDKSYVLEDTITMDTFFKKDFILYVQDSLYRAIPRIRDGLKKSHGQLIWGTMKEWPCTKAKNYKSMVVAQLGPGIAKVVDYHHNPDCLSKAVINFTQNFVGSHNLNILDGKGRMGSRYRLGKDSGSPRYVSAVIGHYFYLLYRPEDDGILSFSDNFGQVYDPDYFLPVIPNVAVNGADGIATGFRCSVMNHNPIEVIDYIKFLLGNTNTEEHPRLVPWYRGFEGKITLFEASSAVDMRVAGIEEAVRDPNGDDEIAEEATENDDVDDDEKTCKSWVEMRGCFDVDDKGVVTVTEIPIGISYQSYNNFLTHLRQEKVIKEHTVHDKGTKTTYKIKGMENPGFVKLGLIKKFGLNNMRFLDDNGVPKKYNKIEDYIFDFATLRLEKYQERKDYMIAKIKEKIDKLEERIKFISAVVDEKIIISKRPVAEIKDNMIKLGIDPTIYNQVQLNELSAEKLEQRLEEQKDELHKLKEMKKTEAKELWLRDLEELRNELLKDKEMIRDIPGIYVVKS